MTEERHKSLFLLLLVCALLAIPRICFTLTDPAYREFFVEEKASGYAARNAVLHGTWDSGGGRFQSAAYLPAATVLSYASFKIFSVGIQELRLPFVLASVVGLFFMGLALLRRYGDRLGLAMLGAYGAAPFIMALNASAVDENLFFCVVPVMIYLFTLLDGENTPTPGWTVTSLIGILSAAAVAVKVDGGGIVTLSAAAAVTLGRRGWTSRMRALCGFLAGGALGAGVYLLYILAVPGFEATRNLYEFFGDIWKHNGYLHQEFGDYIFRLLVVVPRNLHAFVPFMLFFGAFGFILCLLDICNQPVATKFTLSILVVSIFTLVGSPLLYWKRFVVPVIALFWVSASFLNDMHKGLYDRKKRTSFLAAAFAACVLTIAAVVSTFNGHWRVILVLSACDKVACVLACVFAVGILALVSRPGIALYYCGLLLCGGIVLQGAIFFSGHQWRCRGSAIGAGIANIVSNSDVLAEEQAYRYFAYASDASVTFMHENDPDYPDGLIRLAQSLQPSFIVVSDAYRKSLPEMVLQNLPNYILSGSFQYTQPRVFFEHVSKPQNITVFRRCGKETGPGMR